MIRNKWVTYRKAHGFSYENNYKPGFQNAFTRGIFHQMANAGSFNGHGRSRSRSRRRRRHLLGASQQPPRGSGSVPPSVYVFCYTIVLPPFLLLFVMASLPLTIYYCLSAFFDLTPHGTRLTIIPLNQSSINHQSTHDLLLITTLQVPSGERHGPVPALVGGAGSGAV
jgi:hypothetical protein